MFAEHIMQSLENKNHKNAASRHFLFVGDQEPASTKTSSCGIWLSKLMLDRWLCTEILMPAHSKVIPLYGVGEGAKPLLLSITNAALVVFRRSDW